MQDRERFRLADRDRSRNVIRFAIVADIFRPTVLAGRKCQLQTRLRFFRV